MPIRNPFKKTGPTALEPALDEGDQPGSRSGSEQGFERQSVAGSTRSSTKSSTALSIKGSEPDEYKLCGVFPAMCLGLCWSPADAKLLTSCLWLEFKSSMTAGSTFRCVRFLLPDPAMGTCRNMLGAHTLVAHIALTAREERLLE